MVGRGFRGLRGEFLVFARYRLGDQYGRRRGGIDLESLNPPIAIGDRHPTCIAFGPISGRGEDEGRGSGLGSLSRPDLCLFLGSDGPEAQGFDDPVRLVGHGERAGFEIRIIAPIDGPIFGIGDPEPEFVPLEPMSALESL